MDTGNDANEVIPKKKNRPDWLVGRQGKVAASTETPATPQSKVEELNAKISQLESEMEAKVNRKVQQNMAWLLKKLGEANPGLKVDVTDFCATVSSDGDEFGTPITPGTTPGTTTPGTTPPATTPA